ncbi:MULTISPECIES: YbaB/EbfC family nucleoid-associated protein [Mycobacteriaceae]|uniref:YbaB/EbfC family nucleoid-associated protein n=1 Tax=Mycobacteriaceae TaxID=1762 RepID=UPI0008003771|nr:MULTISPECIES: YbaB/EbfC family nucleoid-associated protein [Mycobacteriaceae]MCK0177026.1 YbaB/EbfC family nucleoid-associated protein [Mycolicibacterium sp. F2034L]OBB57716.1 DNA-binding protein [Mycobacterium sp. 852013-51886_SCH5428379]
MHPAVAAVLRQARELQSIMDAQLQKMNTDTFTGSDASRTVEVTLDGHHQLTDVYIADGTLRLGAQTVEARLNEALQNATEAATAAIEADRERIDAMVAELTDRDPFG